MKKITFKWFLTISFFFAILSVNAQQKKAMNTKKASETEVRKSVRCATDEFNAHLEKTNKGQTSRADFEAWLAPIVNKINADKAAGNAVQAVYNIPLVVHIIHNGVPVNDKCGIYGENISYAQAFSQVQVLNNDYRRLMGTPGGTNSTGLSVDSEINFCLAQQDPSGNPTDGIVRHQITPTVNAFTPGDPGDWETFADADAMKAATIWDPTKYMNMWSIRVGGDTLANGGMSDLLGYAQFPAAGTSGLADLAGSTVANTDGVVAGHTVFGDISADDGSFTMNPTYDLGRTMTHEVGHWLGLYHTFQGGCAGGGDLCADTPAIAAPNYTCVAADSCGGGGADMIQNYMDYTNDACMDAFTADQKTRMQAVMSGSPRRSTLNTSNGCNVPANTYVRFNNGSECFATVAESNTDCGFTDYTMTLEVTKAPAGGNADITVTKAGTATDMADYEVIGGNVTFAIGDATDKTFTLRVYNDGFVESSETINLSFTVTPNGGDALVTTETSKDFVVTVTDNDVASATTVLLTHFSDDFEDMDVSDWTFTDSDGDGNNFGDQLSIGAVTPSSSLISRSWIGSALTPDNWAVSSAIDLTGATGPIDLDWKVQAAAAAWDLEKYSVYVSTSSAIGTLVGSATTFTEIYDDPAGAGSSYARNLDLSAHAGQIVYVAFRHWDCTDQDWLSIDDVTVTSSVSYVAETVVHAADQNYINGNGTAYADNSGNFVADITNNNGVNYGCVSANVSRNGDFGANAAVMYQVAGVANYVMAKTYAVTPTTVQVAGNSTVKFYFFADEIQDWVTQTGNVEGDLMVIKNNGSTSEAIAATLGNFGIYRTIEATFATGINGTYYFGKQEAILGISENQFNVFSVYPNPSNGIFNLSVSTVDDAQVKLFDIRGRNVYSKLHANNSDVFNTTLDFSSLASGVYMLDVESGSKRAVKKIVIQ